MPNYVIYTGGAHQPMGEEVRLDQNKLYLPSGPQFIYAYKLQYFLDFLIIGTVFYNIIQYFLKYELGPKTSKIGRGVCRNLFFIDRTPPLPPPYCAIALLLKNNHSYICPDTFILRCPPIGSFYHIFWTLLLGLHILQ